MRSIMYVIVSFMLLPRAGSAQDTLVLPEPVVVTRAPHDWVTLRPRRIELDHVARLRELDHCQVVCNIPELEAALAARRYSVADRLVLGITGPGGVRVVALDGGPDGAECGPTDAAPDVVADAAVLGACLLGGSRWADLAAAGRVTATPEALRRADAMFAWSPAPAMLSSF